jgi:hypothetical protein
MLPSGFATKPCMHLFSPPYVLHNMPISFFLIWSREWYFVQTSEVYNTRNSGCYLYKCEMECSYTARNLVKCLVTLNYMLQGSVILPSRHLNVVSIYRSSVLPATLRK